ncbi:MAG: DUF2383 domain-containing protein [Armatimonadetes bacterium]|nr:DUF2383 domain-containing protein [Akkermansiaceae bacterium]
MNETNHEECIKICNSLLRGELSAVETYEKAIEKYPSIPITPELTRIQTEHRLSADRLTANVREMGGTPETDSGAWGAFANTVQNAANLFGTESAIESLQTGEKHGRSDYMDALEDKNVMDACKIMIRTELLPRVENHIEVLSCLEDTF